MALLAVAVLLGGCQQDDFPNQLPEAREGYVALRFSADIPAQEETHVASRAVDPDGGGVQNMTLFCFDDFGLFISTASAKKLTSTESYNGSFTAEVPDNTRRVHFVANQNMTDFQEDHFRNKSESEVMALLEGSAGHMIYWARFACDNDNTDGIAAQLQSKKNKITMLRNHALIEIKNPKDNDYIVVTGMRAYNINAFGTVAPYSPTKGFAFTLDDWKNEDFVTLPQNDAKQSDVTDVTTDVRQYIFEQENRFDDPVSIIIKGHAPDTSSPDLYYRVMLVDDSGEQILVRRNHKYILNIEGALSYGQETFEAATTAPATNNVWISISDDVTEVEDANYILTVEKTSDVFDESEMEGERTRGYTYTITSKNTEKPITEADKPQITWLDNSVAAQATGGDFNVVDGVGKGTIIISPRSLGSNEKQEGTLLVKHGLLQRKIKVVMIKKQTFVPSWIGTAVYGVLGGDKNKRPHVTLMFTIPETCPEELFPMNVYITANELDIRAAAGNNLPVVRKVDTEWYSSGDIPESARPDYKFVYTVEKPGVQRVYFENILNQEVDKEGAVYIEAKHFETMKRTYAFSNTKNSITVDNLYSYNATSSELAADEKIYYCVVPQKKYAHIKFDMQLKDEENSDAINAGANDEFLFYTQNLNNYNATSDPKEITIADCYFSQYNAAAEAWMTEYNAQGGRMLMFKPRSPDNPSGGTGKYFLYMYTNRAKSAEVVRIASNLKTWNKVEGADVDVNTGMYDGKIYRSTTFEVYNYNPFRFGARVKYADGEWAGPAAEPADGAPEEVTPLEWSYKPGQKVDIAFDVTSFMHNGYNGQYSASVSPFADEVEGINLPKEEYFEIYIDAPMLKIDESRLTECKLNGDKLKADPNVPGRFIYRASINRETERKFGTDKAMNKDNSSGVVQDGERKTLPFIVNSIVSAGDIVLSSNEEQVVFYSKTFRVANKSIEGTIKYADGKGNQYDVPAGNFVAFERTTNSNRIGAVTITGTGKYTLRLRKEYPLNWYSYPVAFHYEKDGQIYHARYNSLSDMFAAQEKGETVILMPEPKN